MPKISFLTGLLLCSLNGAAWAATTINFILQQVDQPGDVLQTAYIDSGKILIKAAGGDPRMDLLFEQSTETMTVIDHTDRTTLDIDAEKVATLAGQAEGMMSIVQQQLAKQMENMSEAERKKLQEVIENLGGGQLVKPAPPPPPEQTYKEAGTKKINGFDCQMTEVLENGSKVSETCTATPDSLNLPAVDYQVIQAMQAMSSKLQEKTAKISGQMGQNVPQFGHEKIPGVPVMVKDRAGNTMSITNVSAGIGDAKLQKPTGYSTKQMPSLPMLTQ